MEKESLEILKHYIDSEARSLSERFMEKYWLTNAGLKEHWLPIKNSIFSSKSKDLPDLMFKDGFRLIAQRGGFLFTKEEYIALQNCMKISGDKFFVVIENNFKRSTANDFPHLRFKFPVDTTWEMLNNGNVNFPDISYEILYIINKHFFVFGDSGKWGKYAASDYFDTPIDVIGVKPELAPIFHEQFNPSIEEKKEIYEWLPEKYKERIKKPIE